MQRAGRRSSSSSSSSPSVIPHSDKGKNWIQPAVTIPPSSYRPPHSFPPLPSPLPSPLPPLVRHNRGEKMQTICHQPRPPRNTSTAAIMMTVSGAHPRGVFLPGVLAKPSPVAFRAVPGNGKAPTPTSSFGKTHATIEVYLFLANIFPERRGSLTKTVGNTPRLFLHGSRLYLSHGSFSSGVAVLFSPKSVFGLGGVLSSQIEG